MNYRLQQSRYHLSCNLLIWLCWLPCFYPISQFLWYFYFSLNVQLPIQHQFFQNIQEKYIRPKIIHSLQNLIVLRKYRKGLDVRLKINLNLIFYFTFYSTGRISVKIYNTWVRFIVRIPRFEITTFYYMTLTGYNLKIFSTTDCFIDYKIRRAYWNLDMKTFKKVYLFYEFFFFVRNFQCYYIGIWKNYLIIPKSYVL